MLLTDFLASTPLQSPANPQRTTGHLFLTVASALIPVLVFSPAIRAQQPAPPLLDAMTTELHRAFTSLGKSSGDDKQLPPYFLSYSVSDASFVSIRAEYGALAESTANRERVADVQVRVGDPKLDNTHGTHRASAVNTLQLPLGDDREALARSLWLATNTGYGNALDNYLRVKTEAQVRAKEEDTSPDFSEQSPQTHIGSVVPPIVIDRAAWEQRVRELSRVFRDYPDVYQNMVMLTVQNETDYFVDAELRARRTRAADQRRLPCGNMRRPPRSGG